MAKKVQRKRSVRRPKAALSIDAANVRIFVTGLVVLGIGYFLLSIGPYDSFWSLTLAPIVLLVAYLAIIPYAILRRSKSDGQEKVTQKANVGG